MKNKWHGTPPKRCDRCLKPIKDVFYDARTNWGQWAILCHKCFKDVGVGLGIGKGQKYSVKVIKGDGELIKSWTKVTKVQKEVIK